MNAGSTRHVATAEGWRVHERENLGLAETGNAKIFRGIFEARKGARVSPVFWILTLGTGRASSQRALSQRKKLGLLGNLLQLGHAELGSPGSVERYHGDPDSFFRGGLRDTLNPSMQE